MKILRNTAYKLSDTGDIVRVLYVHSPPKDEKIVIVISLRKKDTMPYEIPLEQFESGITEESILAVEGYEPIVYAEPSEKQQRSAEKNWSMIGSFVLDEPDCFDKKVRSRFISAKSRETGVNKRQIARLLYRYWAGGMSMNALFPHNDKIGNAGKPRQYKGAVGRPVQTQTDNKRLLIQEEELSNIRKYINLYYNKHTKYQFRYAYLQMIKACYTDDNTGQLLERYPTETQFYYHGCKFVDEKRRFGSTVYNKDRRGITGSSRSEANGPGETYQIDATIADVYLVAHGDPSVLVGRPELYFVTDVFSRMIVGFYTCLESASWENARLALMNAFLPKSTFCQTYGIAIHEEAWPCAGLPRELIVDNGELISKASNVLISNLGITVKNAPAWRPDLKGIVESKFRLLNIDLKANMPGAVYPDFNARGGTDYRLDAKLNLTDFTKLVIHFILHYNGQQKAEHPQPFGDVQKAEVPAIPLALWNWGLANRTNVLRQMHQHELEVALSQRGQATVMSKGIKFHNTFYECETAIAENWFSRARVHRTWKIDIGYHPSRMDHIYWLKTGGTPEVCHLTNDAVETFTGSSFEEMSALEKRRNVQKMAYEGVMMQRSIDHLCEIESIVEGAVEASKVIPITTKKTKTKALDIRENRKIEAEKWKEAVLTPQPEADVPKAPPVAQETTYTSSYDAKFAQFQEEDDT